MKSGIRTLIITFAICIAVVSLFTLAAVRIGETLWKDGASAEAIIPANISTASERTEKTLSEKPSYIIKLYDGNIGVFYSDAPDLPLIVSDINISGLRSADIGRLSDGIRAGSYQEVLQYLEDFNS